MYAQQSPPPPGLETTTYSYDNLNRVVQVVFNDGYEKNYVYDNLGNRTQLNINTLSVDEEALKNVIVLYPNPSEDILNIKIPDNIDSKNASIQLYDINGRLVTQNVPSIIDNKISVEINTLSNGVYLIHLISGNQKWSKLFIKK